MDDKKILNREQLEAVHHGDGPLLIIAGAGTGKTTVITERIKYLVLEKNIPPSQILALTFTDKAAREMEERVDVAMPYGYTQMWIMTFHGFCDRILRSEAVHIGLTSSYKLLTEAESILFLRNNLFKFNLSYFRPLGNPNKFLQGLLQHFSRLKDEDILPNEYLHWAQAPHFAKASRGEQNSKEETKKNMELANAYQVYEELKTKEGVMDFSDLISNTLKLFRERKNVLKIYQEQFKHILVDEFQDTNYAQNELSTLLTGAKKNITVVGDDDQAIYRWRGAAISNIIQFKKRFPKAKIITLTKNYRSTEEILNKSYKLIQNNNPDRLEAKEKINKKLISVRNIKGEKVELLSADRVENEAELVTKKIQELTMNHKLLTNYQYKDIAILVRANDHSQPFVRALERQNIPYQFLGPGQLFHQEEIKDLIAYLKVLYNFSDSVSLYRVLNMPIFGFDARDIAAILNFGRRTNLSLFEALENIDKTFLNDQAKEKVNKFIQMIKKHLKRVPKDTGGQILYYFLEDSGLLKKLMEAKSGNDYKKSQNIARFFDKLKTYEGDHEDSSVFAIVDWIDLSMQMGESPLATNMDWTENDAVNILTIHSSKGLEFPVVFIVNLVSQRFPTRERREQIPIPQELIKEILPLGDFHLEEERRLFYVGLTRARDLLFLTTAKYYGEGKRERKLSPFVYETLEERDILNTLKLGEKNIIQQSLFSWEQKSKPPTPIATIPPLTYISYSQLQTFDICPLHYKLKYLLRIPTPSSSAQSFGTSLHAALRDFFRDRMNGKKVKIKDISSYLNRVWINEGYSSKTYEEYALKKAKDILGKYLDRNFNPDDKNVKQIALEFPFQFRLKDIKVAGRIDRIDQIGKTIEILDYKTGNNMLNDRQLAQDLQLTFYALAAMEVHDDTLNRDPKNVLLSLYYLDQQKKLTTSRTKEQLEEAKKIILEKVDAISKSDFKCSGSSICKNCEYKILCKAN